MPIAWRTILLGVIGTSIVLLAAGCSDDEIGGPSESGGGKALPRQPLQFGLPTPTSYGDTCGAEPQVCSCRVDNCRRGVPASLDRPLAMKELPGSDCRPTNGGLYSTAGFGGVRLGHGPVAPIITPERGLQETEAGTLRFTPAGHGWYGVKTLWYASRNYKGPVLLRGGRLGTDSPVAFGEKPAELARQIPAGRDSSVNQQGGVRQWPGGTFVRSPGCFAWQVDGTTFSYTIVFRALIVARG